VAAITNCRLQVDDGVFEAVDVISGVGISRQPVVSVAGITCQLRAIGGEYVLVMGTRQGFAGDIMATATGTGCRQIPVGRDSRGVGPVGVTINSVTGSGCRTISARHPAKLGQTGTRIKGDISCTVDMDALNSTRRPDRFRQKPRWH